MSQKSCLARAVAWGHLEENPVAQKVKRLKEDTKAKVRYLTPDEEARLLDALDAREERIRRERESYNAWCRERGYPERETLRDRAFVDHLRPMVLLSLHTGLRRGEVFNLRWEDIDLQRAMLTVSGASAKSGYTRHVPLNETARATLEAWRRQSTGADLVFPNKDGRAFDNCNTSWESVLKEARITGFRWHDMRHTFASKLVMAGVDLNTVRELLGHSDIKMTLRYAHLAPQVKAAAVAKLVSNTVPLEGKREGVSIP